MIYGNSYEGSASECACGHVTNVFANCGQCSKVCCENCEHESRDNRYCSDECRQEACEHLEARVDEGYDVNDEYVTYWEHITCRDCGQELRENRSGELEVRKARRAA